MKRRAVRAARMTLRSDELALSPLLPSGLFLDRFTPEALRSELGQHGLLRVLAERGFPDVVLRADRAEREHRLRVLAASAGPLLIELRLDEATLGALPPAIEAAGLRALHALVLLWMVLQNPRAAFTPDRPRLPGQDHPGLGVREQLYGMLSAWASAWGKDALVNVPEYFHNAVFYSARFHFLDPAEQGRFEALRRDLGPLPVADASAAVESGRVREASSGRPFEWQPGPMAAPLAPALEAAFASSAWLDAVAAAREAARFRIEG